MDKHLGGDDPDVPDRQRPKPNKQRPKEIVKQEQSRCDDIIGSGANQALIRKAKANVKASGGI